MTENVLGLLVGIRLACAEEESSHPSLSMVGSPGETEREASKAALPSMAFSWSFNLNCVKEIMLVLLSSVDMHLEPPTRTRACLCGCPEPCLEDQVPVTTKDPLTSPGNHQNEIKCSEHLSLPSQLNSCAALGQREIRDLVSLGCLQVACIFWWWELWVELMAARVGRWDWHQSTAARSASPNSKEHNRARHVCITEVCVSTQSVLWSGSGFNAKLPFTCCCYYLGKSFLLCNGDYSLTFYSVKR